MLNKIENANKENLVKFICNLKKNWSLLFYDGTAGLLHCRSVRTGGRSKKWVAISNTEYKIFQ